MRVVVSVTMREGSIERSGRHKSDAAQSTSLPAQNKVRRGKDQAKRGVDNPQIAVVGSGDLKARRTVSYPDDDFI